MHHEQTQQLSNRQFKRLVGVEQNTFNEMVAVMRSCAHPKQKLGCPTKLSLEDQVLVALQYWREYRTYFHMAQDWGVSESTICRIVHHVETTLIQAGKFRLAGKKSLLQGFGRPQTVVIDVTESLIERPKRGQKQFFSGKKKRHTFKSQLVLDLDTGKIRCTAHGKGKRHDFRLFQVSGVHFHPDTESLADKGYQGIAKLHANSQVPKKKPRGGQLSAADKQFNRTLARRRVVIEHVNRRLKVFRILGERYRNGGRRFGLRYNLLAALYNHELQQAVSSSSLVAPSTLSQNIFARDLFKPIDRAKERQAKLKGLAIEIGQGAKGVYSRLGTDTEITAETLEQLIKVMRQVLGDEMAEVKITPQSISFQMGTDLETFLRDLNLEVTQEEVEQ